MANYDLGIIQGSTFSSLLTLTNSDNTPINLTNYSVTGQIRYSYGSENPLLALKPTIYSAVSGMVRLIISGSESENLPVGIFPYDLELQNSDTVLKPLAGYAIIGPEVSRE